MNDDTSTYGVVDAGLVSENHKELTKAISQMNCT
jgi:hypothetical protein